MTRDPRTLSLADLDNCSAAASVEVAVGEMALGVTVSNGLAYSPLARSPSIGNLLKVADRCLYRAKEGGRDRVEREIPDAEGDRGKS